MDMKHDHNLRTRTYEYNRIRSSYGANEAIIKEEKYLEHLDNTRKFDRRLYEKGEKWASSGLKLEDASEEYRNNQSFISGFNHGLRLLYINELDNNSKKR